MDTDLTGNAQAFNPAELLLAALAACIIKGIERVTPILKFQSDGVRQNEPPKMISIKHENVRRYGTVFNTVAPVTALSGTLRRV